MARTVTLAAMRTDVRQRTDQEGSTFVTDAELTVWINAGIAAAWQKFADMDPDRYVVTQDITTTANDSDYLLAADFMAIRTVQDVTASDFPIELLPMEASEEVGFHRHPFRRASRYRIFGGGITGATASIRLLPVPHAGRTVRVLYVQAPPRLSADGDLYDGIVGLEDYPIEFAAVKVRAKAEEDPTPHLLALQEMDRRVSMMVGSRDVGEGHHIARVRRRRRGRFPRWGAHD
jgi:hypothetical protein